MVEWDKYAGTKDKMPVITDSTFRNNKNKHIQGSGAFSIYDGFSYRKFPVSLTIANCIFEGNQGARSGGIHWDGVNLDIRDTIFK